MIDLDSARDFALVTGVATSAQGLRQIIAAHAARTPEAVALLSPDGRAPLTYSRLLELVDSTVAALNGMGIGRNDRVALVLPNGPEAATAFVAVAAGASSAPLNPAYQTSEFDFYLADLKARALLVQAGMDSPAREVAAAQGIPIIELTPDRTAASGSFTLTAGLRTPATRPGFACPEDVALLLHTSGTTARPKLVPLTQANLGAAAGNIGAALGLTATDRCLNVMPLFHVHGLIGCVLAPLVAGGSVISTPGFYGPGFFQWLAEFRPTWYSAAPAIHQMVLSRADQYREIIRQRPLRFIRSSAAPLPRQVMAELEKTFDAPVIEGYGMTESALQLTCNPLPPQARKPGSVGTAAGVEVAIMDGAGEFLPCGVSGEVVARGPSLMPGYADNAEANRLAFTRGWFRTGDLGYLDAQGYLFITGRIKEIINRGGEKISPREVDEVLLAHPAVQQAVAFAMPDARLGEEVAAAVTLRPGETVTAEEIQEFVACRLADFKVPRRVLLLDELPKGPTGKLQRIGLAQRLGVSAVGESSQTRPAFVAPRDALESRLAKIWEDVLKVRPVGVKDDFFHLGGDSILAASLFARIQRELEQKLPLATLFQTRTVEQLANVLRRGKAPQWSSLVEIQPQGNNLPFFCVHGAGGHALGFTALAQQVGKDRPFYGLEAPGRDGEQPPLTSVEELAAHYLDQVRRVQLHGPYLLGGLCMGGLVALEMAQRLRAEGEDVALVVMLDTPYPSGQTKIKNKLGQLAKMHQRFTHHLRALARLPFREWPSYILEKLGLLKTALAPASPVRAINHRAGQKYAPQPYSGRVILFLAQGERRPSSARGGSGWETLVVGGLERHYVPGNLNTMLREPHVRALGQQLRACLEEAQTISEARKLA